MFEKLIDVIMTFIEEIFPFIIINQYDLGVILRFGKYSRTLEPGFHWKIPFVDRGLTHTVVTTTLSIPAQSVTTKDEKPVVVKSVVKYNIDNIKDFLLEVYDAKDAISDMTQSIIREQINGRNWSECNDKEFDNTVTKKLRTEMKKWGIFIQKVTMTDIGIIRSMRLFNETESLKA
jgi:regulator of protease activity HflC (stomatin/prohibitin superfamily)